MQVETSFTIEKGVKKVLVIIKNIFDSLTNKQVKQIANAVSNITGFAIIKYGYNFGTIPGIPVLINEKEDFILGDTFSTEVKYYPFIDGPYSLKVKEDYNPPLLNGEYIRVYRQIDNNSTIETLHKSFPKDYDFGVYTTGAYFQLSKENFGNDLQQTSPYNLVIENTTNERPNLNLYSRYYSKIVSSESGSVQATPWTNWDYIYPYWSLDLRGKQQGIKFELYEMSNPDNPVLYSQQWAYPENNYQGNNWIGQMYNNGGNRNWKLKILYF